ncbi:MAG: VWA domain-containing protein [Acidobacteriota bacterium]|nr:VWA domain-containing protein [Acidobacteriota bacterium]
MNKTLSRTAAALLASVTSASVLAYGAGDQDPQRPTISRTIELVRNDVIVRDREGRFIPDLKKDEFIVSEDGVLQELSTMVLSTGGRIFNIAAPPAVTAPEGIILPQSRPATDASGRIFLIFIDDLHLDFRNTGRIRDLLKKVATTLIHDGDLFGIVSTGPSSLAIDMTYDRNRLDEAIKKVSGAGLKPSEIMEAPEGPQGPSEIRHRAHVAFATVNEILGNLEKVVDRRKAVIYISNGYDFDPFPDYRQTDDREFRSTMRNSQDTGDDPFQRSLGQNQFSDADLAMELGYLTRAANRANATFYTIDPRGLVGGPDIDENINPTEWAAHVRKSTDTLQIIANQTGGFALVNSNDFNKGLQRIDNETSDYYVIGYYSTNPDPLKRTRKIDIKVKRAGMNLTYRSEYTLRPLAKSTR